VNHLDEIIIYCDGGCRGNQKAHNIGGWGVILQYRGQTKELYGGAKDTTNNIMELTAAIRALEALKTEHVAVSFYIDSAYVVNGMKGWINSWIRQNWKTSTGKPVKNKELWIQLYALASAQRQITFHKVKGHNGIELNERADALANRGMDEIEKETI
jgi:ribonuclease HI